MPRTFPGLALMLAAILSPLARGQPIEPDPRLVTGELDNGLRYIVLRHGVPPGRAAVWLHVATGSLNETDRQRGIAHFLEHMAFNGSEHFPPGTVLPFFQSLGMTFGVHQNAFTSFGQTVYQVALPDNTPETLGKGLLFLSDVAFGLSLPPEEIEKERRVILEEKRAGESGMRRAAEEVMKRWAPGSLIGERLPIGVEETIRGVTADDFRDYYRHWYVPSNMTVLAVADMDAGAVAGAIREHFARGERVAPPPRPDPRVTAARENRALVVSDPELPQAGVSLLRVTPPRGPSTTVPDARRDLVESIGQRAFNRRLTRLVAQGRASFQRGSASASDSFRAVRIAEVGVTGDATKWRPMLAEIGTELRRAVLHGFTRREIEDARKDLLAAFERGAATEDTLPASALISAMNNALADGEPITSARQDLDLARTLLPTITPDEVAAAFRADFDPAPPGLLFVLQVPASGEVPSEAEFLALGGVALDVAPDAQAEGERAASLMDHPPDPGRIVELSFDAPSGVWSAWLSDNIRVHHRFMDDRKDQVIVTISLAGGTIQETAEDRGIADAAALAWQRPATSRLSSTDIRDLMTGRKVTVSGRPGMDTMAISIAGSPDDLEEGFRLAHLMLTDPVIEPAALDQWREQQKQLLAFRAMQIELTAVDRFSDAIYPPGDARFRPLTAAQIDAITLERAQAWLRSLIARAPIEVSIVGDVPRGRAMDLARAYLGSLPTRPRIGPSTLDDLRALDRPPGPIRVRDTLPTPTDKAIVIAGFFGAERDAIDDQRRLSLAGRILTTRMIRELREDRQLVYSIGVNSSPAQEFPGYGTVFAFSSTDPARAEELAAAIESMFARFAREGPTEEEMATARRQVRTVLDERMREPAFWNAAISTRSYRGTRLADVVGAPAAYEACTGDVVREAFARYCTPLASFSAVVTPANPAGAGDAPPLGSPHAPR